MWFGRLRKGFTTGSIGFNLGEIMKKRVLFAVVFLWLLKWGGSSRARQHTIRIDLDTAGVGVIIPNMRTLQVS